MTTSDIPTSDTVGTTAKTVRFPTMLAERLELAANDYDRSFSQEVILACRRYFEAMEQPDRSTLETPGAGESAPAFRLVPRWQGEPHPPPRDVPENVPYTAPEPDGFVCEVEGQIVPHLAVTKSIMGSEDAYWLSLDNRFGVEAHSYEELWRWGWFIAHAIAIGEGRASHAYPGRIRQLVDEGWDVMDASGCGGQSVEVTLTFGIPAMADGDQWAYEIRDMLSRTAYDAGARDVCTRLIGLAPLEIDRRGLEPQEIAEIVELDPRDKPVSQVLTVPSATHEDGTTETTTIEIGVVTSDSPPSSPPCTQPSGHEPPCTTT